MQGVSEPRQSAHSALVDGTGDIAPPPVPLSPGKAEQRANEEHEWRAKLADGMMRAGVADAETRAATVELPDTRAIWAAYLEKKANGQPPRLSLPMRRFASALKSPRAASRPPAREPRPTVGGARARERAAAPAARSAGLPGSDDRPHLAEALAVPAEGRPMSAQPKRQKPPGPTPLQVAWLAQLEVYAAVRQHLSLDERQAFWAKSAIRVAHETAQDADWEAWEEQRR